MHYNPTSVGGHHSIIISVKYFTKWAKEMTTFSNDSEIVEKNVFN